MAHDVSFFRSDGFRLAYIDPASGGGQPVLLVHGFASNHAVNWVAPGWTDHLSAAGYRPVAFDNRGHGVSDKSRDPADYAPGAMARDVVALLDHLGLRNAHVFGYSMGARIAAFLALAAPERVATLIFGGLGAALIEGGGDWDGIGAALLADDPADVPAGRPRMFRAFADQTRSDRTALAACIAGSRALLRPDDVRRIRQPVLVGVGSKDDIAGAPGPLLALLPHAEGFTIENRDHMLSVGDRSFKARVLRFLGEHPIGADAS